MAYEEAYVPNPLALVLRHCLKASTRMLVNQTMHIFTWVMNGTYDGQPDINWSTILAYHVCTHLENNGINEYTTTGSSCTIKYQKEAPENL